MQRFLTPRTTRSLARSPAWTSCPFFGRRCLVPMSRRLLADPRGPGAPYLHGKTTGQMSPTTISLLTAASVGMQAEGIIHAEGRGAISHKHYGMAKSRRKPAPLSLTSVLEDYCTWSTPEAGGALQLYSIDSTLPNVAEKVFPGSASSQHAKKSPS